MCEQKGRVSFSVKYKIGYKFSQQNLEVNYSEIYKKGYFFRVEGYLFWYFHNLIYYSFSVPVIIKIVALLINKPIMEFSSYI